MTEAGLIVPYLISFTSLSCSEKKPGRHSATELCPEPLNHSLKAFCLSHVTRAREQDSHTNLGKHTVQFTPQMSGHQLVDLLHFWSWSPKLSAVAWRFLSVSSRKVSLHITDE